ncbi:oocyte zinc finger protein XlCOF29-like [Ranitomeya imitator]|uniref:oocyte zinc finger protein XlCOF29-like n=1 Tax=Ranitomeya imitator TaxID=111125 RepID=UPI0037E83BE4
MNKDRDKMVERILHLTLEILFCLTGEDYTVVKKTSSERCQTPLSEGWGRPLSPITGPPPLPLIHEDINDQKILELTYKMIELLTGEVTLLGILGHYAVMGEDLTHINTTETYVRGDKRCKEEIPTHDYPVHNIVLTLKLFNPFPTLYVSLRPCDLGLNDLGCMDISEI